MRELRPRDVVSLSRSLDSDKARACDHCFQLIQTAAFGPAGLFHLFKIAVHLAFYEFFKCLRSESFFNRIWALQF